MIKKQLFLLHFAGGNCYSFEFLRPYLNDFEFTAVELPGRGKRIHEKLLHNFEEAGRDLFGQITNKLGKQEFLIYGHSLGALLAIHVAKLLEDAGQPPLHIIATGNPGPGVKDYSQVFSLSREDFKHYLEQMGGLPPEFLQEDELFDFFEPIIRADFRLAEGDYLQYIQPVNVPVYVAVGSDEDFAGEINNWEQYTNGGYVGEIWPGNHFFIHHQPQRLAEKIRLYAGGKLTAK
jgi:surfactin synthase thioesterase subunit